MENQETPQSNKLPLIVAAVLIGVAAIVGLYMKFGNSTSDIARTSTNSSNVPVSTPVIESTPQIQTPTSTPANIVNNTSNLANNTNANITPISTPTPTPIKSNNVNNTVANNYPTPQTRGDTYTDDSPAANKAANKGNSVSRRNSPQDDSDEDNLFGVNYNEDVNGEVTSKNAALYQEPDFDSQVIKTYSQGYMITIVKRQCNTCDWYWVKTYKNKLGWMNKNQIKFGINR